MNPGYGENAGVGHYTYYLVKNLLKLDKQNEYVLFFDNLLSKNAAEELVARASNAEIKFFPFHRYKHYLPLAFSHLLVAAALEKEKLDIFHSPAYVLPLAYKGRAVVTVHDLAIYKHPEWFPKKFFIGQKFSTKILVPESLKKAEKIIAVSGHTKKDIIEIFVVNPGKIEVIYEGVETEDPSPEKETVCGLENKICFDDMKEKYGLEEEYVLFLGTVEPRKNIVALVRAFAALAERNKEIGEKYQLVLAGAKGWKYKDVFSEIEKAKKKIGEVNLIKYLGYIPAGDKVALIKHSSCFVFPSLYEGFGLPVLEALSLGVPTITSNVSSLPEVAGGAAITVDPRKTEDLSAALEKVLSDENLRASLSREGKKQAGKFSWEKCAGETLEVYKKAAK